MKRLKLVASLGATLLVSLAFSASSPRQTCAESLTCLPNCGDTGNYPCFPCLMWIAGTGNP